MRNRLVSGLVIAVAILVVGAVAVAGAIVWRPAMLRGTIERLASSQLGMPVSIGGQIDVDFGRVTTVELGGISVAAPEWAQSPTLPTVDRLRVGVDVGAWWSDDRIVLTELLLGAPKLALERDAAGRASWPTEPAAPEQAATPAEPATPPEIRALTIDDGDLSYRDAVTRVNLDARIATGAPVADGQFAGLQVEGHGSALDQPVELRFEVGSPLMLAKADAPFPIRGSLRSGDSEMTVEGKVRDALALDGLDLAMTLQSPDPAPLLALMGRVVEVGAAPQLAARGRVTSEGSVFAARDLAIDWGQSHAEGELSYAMVEPRRRVDGRLHATLLDLVELRPVIEAKTAAEPEQAEITAGPLATHDGMLELTVDRIRLPATEISDLAMTARLQDGQLAADPLRLTLPQGGVAGKLAFHDLDSGSFAGDVTLKGDGIDLAGWLPDTGIAGKVAVELAGKLAGGDLAGLLTESDLRLTAKAVDLVLPQLGGEPSNLALSAALASTGERPLTIHAEGEQAGQALNIDAQGGRLDALLAPSINYPLGLTATIGNSTAKLDGTLAWPLTAGGLDMAIDLATRGLDLGALLGPEAAAAGLLAGTATGRLKGGTIGEILSRSQLKVQAEAAELRLPQLGQRMEKAALTASLAPDDSQPLQAKLTGTVEGQALEITAMGGRLDALLASSINYPLSLTAKIGSSTAKLDGTLAWPLTAGGLDMAVELASQGLDLGALAGPDAPIGGLMTGTATGRLKGGTVGEVLNRSQLKLQGEVTKLRLPQLGQRMEKAALTASLAPDSGQPLQAKLTGTVDGQALEMSAAGGKLDGLMGGSADYPLRLAARIGETSATAEGTVAWPLERGGLRLAMSVAGPDPAQVLRLLELPEIALPPYKLAGDLRRDGAKWRLASIDGRVGDSDLTGELGVDLGGRRPALNGTLHSKVLDLDDLLGLVGAEQATGPGETTSGEQKAEARAGAKDDEVLPDQRFDPASWRQLDVDIGLKADKVNAGILPLDSFDLKVILEDGRLRVDPMLLRLGEGRLDGTIAVDGQQRPAAAKIEIDLVRLPVGRLLERLDIDTSSFGTLSGRARGGVGVSGRGASVAEILGSADGAVTLVMEGGKVNRRVVDLLGFDFLNMFGTLLGTTPSELNLTCTLADLSIKDGVVSTQALVLDTDAASLAGEGTVDLDSEKVSIELLARPKGSPLPSGRTGIAIRGTLAEPEISFSAGTLAARGAAAATLGVFLRPFTALASAVLPSGESAKGSSACATLLAGRDTAGG